MVSHPQGQQREGVVSHHQGQQRERWYHIIRGSIERVYHIIRGSFVALERPIYVAMPTMNHLSDLQPLETPKIAKPPSGEAARTAGPPHTSDSDKKVTIAFNMHHSESLSFTLVTF